MKMRMAFMYFLEIVLTLHGSLASGTSSNFCFFLSLTLKDLLGKIVWINQKFSGMSLTRVLREGELEERAFIHLHGAFSHTSEPKLNPLGASPPAFLVVFTSAFKTPDAPPMFSSGPTSHF